MIDVPQIGAAQKGLVCHLPDGREIKAFLSVDGASTCFVLQATNGSVTRIALSHEAFAVMVMLRLQLHAQEEKL
jgi:hypothetical protein